MKDILSIPKNEIVVYQPNETVRLEVSLRNDSIWLSQQRIADLFGVRKAAISKHLKNVFDSGELRREATVSKMETVQVEGKRSVVRNIEMFNLGAIIAVGYRQQYPNDGLTLTQRNDAHDRFIVCDNTVWLCGASVKDAGRRMFALVKTGLRPELILGALPGTGITV